MTVKVGSVVHPRYRGIANWKVETIAEFRKPIKYKDDIQGNVSYAPRILNLKSSKVDKVLWFAYWISTDKTKGKLKWGQGAPMLEEDTLLNLLKDALRRKFFSDGFIKELHAELGNSLS